MIARHSRAVLFGCVIGILGIVASMLSLVDEYDQSIGLDLLFSMRGPRPAPPEVVIITLDRASALRLDIPRDPMKWPRALHARLVDILSRQGIKVISFDLMFDESRSQRDDRMLAEAIERSGNVILSGTIVSEHILLQAKGRSPGGSVMVETMISPVEQLASAAVATASFPLPRIPKRLDQCWSFKMGNVPTLPVVAMQVYAMDLYDEMIWALARINPALVDHLPRNRQSFFTDGKAQNTVRALRELFKENPSLRTNVLDEMSQLPQISGDARKARTLRALLDMYAEGESHFINYYGPPGSIARVPYYKILETGGEGLDLKGKAVFVGVAEDLRSEQVGGFYTVFSSPDAEDLCSVELAATVFGNLLEGRSINMMAPMAQLAFVFFWGLAIGILCRVMTLLRSGLLIALMSLLYIGLVIHLFRSGEMWLPVFVPVVLQAPLAFVAASVWRYREVRKEREDVRKAMGYYLPDDVIDHMVENIAAFKDKSDMVHGTVLFADAEKYSTLAEGMSPAELKSFMNSYYEVVFTPVKRHGGRVLDVVGDAMLAIWYGEIPDAGVRVKPCQAALEIAEAVAQFNDGSDNHKLPVRIGIHSGHVSIGTVGAIDHYEYRAVGDCVNTASRLEGLNKYLKTRIVVSDDVLAGTDEYLARPLGKFVLAGKVNAVSVHELLCRRERADGEQLALCLAFSRALEAYRSRDWNEAIGLFEDVLRLRPDDGPARFYQMICREFIVKPPPEGWEGSVTLSGK
ncbi:MAG TPA: adenylate/guanylate cyclase domain-containing protein [Syntrophales bacterium]|nr:adenylate/guanylate cyclase domain-containing protein [Syntrophales bacterium]